MVNPEPRFKEVLCTDSSCWAASEAHSHRPMSIRRVAQLRAVFPELFWKNYDLREFGIFWNPN